MLLCLDSMECQVPFLHCVPSVTMLCVLQVYNGDIYRDSQVCWCWASQWKEVPVFPAPDLLCLLCTLSSLCQFAKSFALLVGSDLRTGKDILEAQKLFPWYSLA